MISFNTRLDVLQNANITGAGSTGEFDVSQAVGNINLIVSDRTGGTGATTVSVEHAETSGGSFSAVPASALFNPATGDADTFDNLGTTGSEQDLALNRQQLKRFIRVTWGGTVTSHDVVVAVAYQVQSGHGS